MTRLRAAPLTLLVLAVAGCSPGSSKDHSARATAAATKSTTTTTSSGTTTTGTTTTGTTGAVGSSAVSINLLPGSTAATASGSASSSPITSGSSTAPVPSSSTITPSAPSTPTTPPPASLLVTSPALFGTIPPAPSTGFGGTLYFVGERLVPGSTVEVSYQGAFVKYLPATFYSSEVIGVSVNLTIPGDYSFRAVAPDGTLSTAAPLTVANGTPASLFGLAQPEVHMVYPPSPDTAFAGTMWIMGRDFAPGSTLLVQAPGFLAPVVAPLLHSNDETLGWVTATLIPGDYVLQVLNPSLQVSVPFTVTVTGPAPTATPTVGAPLPPPRVYAPSGVTSPFVGSVRLYGVGILPGASAELRDATTQALVSATPLVSVSTAEAWWMLLYPQAGTYEARVVNPDGQATPWRTFDVR